jgi:hypothetical protein
LPGILFPKVSQNLIDEQITFLLPVCLLPEQSANILHAKMLETRVFWPF